MPEFGSIPTNPEPAHPGENEDRSDSPFPNWESRTGAVQADVDQSGTPGQAIEENGAKGVASEAKVDQLWLAVVERRSEVLLNEGLNQPQIKEWLSAFSDEKSPSFHPETYFHIVGMAKDLIKQALLSDPPLTVEDRNLLTFAALAHDIGKARADLIHLVRRDGPLNDDEKKTVGLHAGISAQMIMDGEDFEGKPLVVALVKFHHQMQPTPPYTPEEFEQGLAELKLSDEELQLFNRWHPVFEAVDKVEGNLGNRSYQQPRTPQEVAKNTYDIYVKSGHDSSAVDAVLRARYPDRQFHWEAIETDKGPEAAVTEKLIQAA